MHLSGVHCITYSAYQPHTSDVIGWRSNILKEWYCHSLQVENGCVGIGNVLGQLMGFEMSNIAFHSAPPTGGLSCYNGSRFQVEIAYRLGHLVTMCNVIKHFMVRSKSQKWIGGVRYSLGPTVGKAVENRWELRFGPKHAYDWGSLIW